MTTTSPDPKTPLLDCVEVQTAAQPVWSVLWLHGLGDSGHGFSPIVPDLVRPGWPALRFIFPHAPERAVTCNGGMRMRAWYDLVNLSPEDLSHRADMTGVAESVGLVDALIEREVARGVPAQRILLAGFSQGGAITLAAGMRRRTPLAGLIALSSYLPGMQLAAPTLQAGAERQPLFMAHGRYDPVVPYAAGEQSAALMRQFGFPVRWHGYPMQHQVCAEQIRDLGDWMQALFERDKH